MTRQEDRKKRICMIVPDPMVQGGIAAVTSGYYGSRLEEDYDVTYVQSYRDGSRKDKLLKALKAYVSFFRILCKRKPDLVHIHSSFGPSFFRKMPFILMSRAWKIPVVNHIHGSAFDELYTNASALKKRLVRDIYGKCDCIIALGENWKQTFSQIVPPERITVIPNYAPLHPEYLEESVMAVRRKKQQILFLGMLTEGKGLYEMPEVIRRVTAKLPGAHFALCGIGGDEWLKNNLPPEILKENVLLPGWVRKEEKETFLRESAVFFLPSHMEAMPISVLEAMGCALPVVSTNVGGIPQVAADGDNSVLCEVGDTAAMADALCSYLEDDERRINAGRRSCEIVRQKFSLERHIESIEKVYERILGQNK